MGVLWCKPQQSGELLTENSAAHDCGSHREAIAGLAALLQVPVALLSCLYLQLLPLPTVRSDLAPHGAWPPKLAAALLAHTWGLVLLVPLMPYLDIPASPIPP